MPYTALIKINNLLCNRCAPRFIVKGFTLVEIMITVSIIAILTAGVLPSIGSFSDANILSQAAQNVVSDIENAKFKALAGSVETISLVDYKYWGVVCPTSASSTYNLSSFLDTGTFDAAPSNRAVTLSSGISIICTQSKIVFKRLSGTTVAGSGITITISKTGYTSQFRITVDGNGIISISKI